MRRNVIVCKFCDLHLLTQQRRTERERQRELQNRKREDKQREMEHRKVCIDLSMRSIMHTPSNNMD